MTELGRKYDAEFVYVVDVMNGEKEWKVNIYEASNGEYKHIGLDQIHCA